MARDAIDAEDNWKQEQIDRGLQEFMEGIFLGDHRPKSEGFVDNMRNLLLNSSPINRVQPSGRISQYKQ